MKEYMKQLIKMEESKVEATELLLRRCTIY